MANVTIIPPILWMDYVEDDPRFISIQYGDQELVLPEYMAELASDMLKEFVSDEDYDDLD